MAQVVLSIKSRETYTITLPESGAVVTLYKKMSAGDILDRPENVTRMQMGVYMLERCIKEWEFVDEAKNPLPITKASFDFLDPDDLIFMLADVRKTFNQSMKSDLTKQKKSLSSSTTPAGTDTKPAK